MRLIKAFEAHGIARQPIGRVVPAEFARPMAKLLEPCEPEDRLSAQSLDWAARAARRSIGAAVPWRVNVERTCGLHSQAFPTLVRESSSCARTSMVAYAAPFRTEWLCGVAAAVRRMRQEQRRNRRVREMNRRVEATPSRRCGALGPRAYPVAGGRDATSRDRAWHEPPV